MSQRRAVELVEVGARDGLQNEKTLLSTSDKVKLITDMVSAGVRRLEIGSYVNPRRVPQMADTPEVIELLPDLAHVSYIATCLNLRGVTRAAESRSGGRRGVDEAGCVAIATDQFGLINQNQTVADSIIENCAMLRLARNEGLIPQVTIAVAFGCPFEGEVPMQRILDIASRLIDSDPVEIAVADTIGVAVPAQVTELLGRLRELLPLGIRLRAHFHDTRGTGVANAWAAMEAGVATLDCSIGGLGGCPFAPGATGNVSTEDLVYMLERSGVSTGVDLKRAMNVNRWLAKLLAAPLPSRAGCAGPFETTNGHRTSG